VEFDRFFTRWIRRKRTDNDPRAECTACGASLDASSDEPCPNCGRNDTKKVYKSLVAKVSVSGDSGDAYHNPGNSGRGVDRSCQGRSVGNIGQKVEEQWERVKRYFERFESLSRTGRVHDINSENYVDDIYSFFIHCYHLKDWIAHDPSSWLRAAVESYGKKSDSFQICRDLCIGAKHLTLGNSRSDLVEHRLGRKHVKFNVSTGILTMRVFVRTKDGEREAFDIAEECMREWEAFFSGARRWGGRGISRGTCQR